MNLDQSAPALPGTVPPLDGVQLAVVTARLRGIVKQMANTLFRTGRSGVINTAHDFSCCIVTREGEFLIMADSLPIHVMRSSDRQAQVMKEYHPDLRAGDAYLHNSPYHGNTHPGDFGVLVPVVDDDGEHRFTCVAKAHFSDIGSSIATTQFASARDVYEEGSLIFAATKVQQDYKDIEDIIRLCRIRIRQPDQWYGDYLAILGAARTGERRLLDLGREIGWDTLHQYTGQWFDYSERMMEAAIRRMPSGRVTTYATHDPFPGVPEGVPLKATVEVRSEEGIIEVDLRDNPDSLPNGLNQSWATLNVHTHTPIFNTVGPDVPTNAGSFRRVKLLLREDCCVGIPRHPHSCSVATTCLGNRVGGLVARALAGLGEGLGHAEVGPIQTPGFAIISGNDPRKGDAPFINQLFLGSSGGAGFPAVDGWVTIGDQGAMGMVHMDSIEADELPYPIHIHKRSLVLDGGGAGKFRGAPGVYLEYGPIPGAHIQAIYASDGSIHPAAGARGGLAGHRAEQLLRGIDGSEVDQGPMGPIRAAPGEVIVTRGTGGGGYGPPFERDIERVRRDVSERWVSREAAEALYGVVIRDDGTVDEKGTRSARDRLSITASRTAGDDAPAAEAAHQAARARVDEASRLARI